MLMKRRTENTLKVPESKLYNKRPMGLDALLKNQLGYWPRFQKLHIDSLSSPGGVNLGYLCSTGSGF